MDIMSEKLYKAILQTGLNNLPVIQRNKLVFADIVIRNASVNITKNTIINLLDEIEKLAIEAISDCVVLE